MVFSAGIWGLWDVYTGHDLLSGVYSFTSGVVFLVITRGFRNTLSPPLIAACDLNDEFFEITTRFKVPVSLRKNDSNLFISDLFQFIFNLFLLIFQEDFISETHYNLLYHICISFHCCRPKFVIVEF